jgi:DNA-binding transcriptional ArsR family regulator
MGASRWFVLTGTRGALKRAQILRLLSEQDCSVKRLADALELEYETVQKHLEVLRANDIVESRARGDVTIYWPTATVRKNWDAVTEILQTATDDKEPMRVRSS